MKQIFFSLAMALVTTAVQAQEANANTSAGKILYENNFEKAELEKVPSEFLVLDGGFAIRRDGTNKLFELPGAPLETFGVLFGPTLETNVAVAAKIRGTPKGRRFPTFAVGLNGVGGYKLQVSPAKKALELSKGDEVVTSVPFEEKIGSWMMVQLRNRNVSESEWKIEGKVWLENSVEPNEPMIVFTEKSKPVAGRASIWGSPYSGTPIQFDDLKVISLETK